MLISSGCLLRLRGLVEPAGLFWLAGEFSLRNADGRRDRCDSRIGEPSGGNEGMPVDFDSVGDGDLGLSSLSPVSSNLRIADGEMKGESFRASSNVLRSDRELRLFFLAGSVTGGLTISPMLPREGPFCHVDMDIDMDMSCDIGRS